MTPHQILIVAIRLFAIVWFFHALGHVASSLRFVNEVEVSKVATALTWTFPTLELLACAFLWLAPATLARKLLPHGDQPVVGTAPELHQWQTIGVIVVGLWTLTYSLPDLAYWIVYARVHFAGGGNMHYLFTNNLAEIVATVLQLVIGIWLVLGGKGLAASLYRLQTAGLSK